MPPSNRGLARNFGSLLYTRKGGSFDVQLRKWAKKTEEDLGYIVLDAAQLMGDAVVQSTPFRSGRAKAHWRFGINSRPGGYDRTKRAGIDHYIDVEPLNGWKVGDNIHLYNKAPYVALLEAGMSPQAPAGSIFRDHVANWDLYVAQAARLNDF